MCLTEILYVSVCLHPGDHVNRNAIRNDLVSLETEKQLCVIAVRCVLWFNENIFMMVSVCVCACVFNLNQKRLSVITNSAV